ncbi:MAG: nucleotide kinase domain-containing protein [Candidatus Dojkabacteria bacterium]
MNLRKHFKQRKLDQFWWFVSERQTIWYKRFVDAFPPPWTDDYVLQSERFTNVYRELDPGTQYAIHSILELREPVPDKIFNIMIYRLIGRKETHSRLGFQKLATFDSGQMEYVLKEIRDKLEQPPFTGAYMVASFSQMGSSDKIENIASLFELVQKNFANTYQKILSARDPQEAYKAIKNNYGFGEFLSYQVLVDLLYPLRVNGNRSILPFTHDVWAKAGPGAKRGIGILLKKNTKLKPLDVMLDLRRGQRQEFTRLGIDFPFLRDTDGTEREISLANIQNCLCEYHKYVKIGEGTGKGRRKFRA